MKVSPIARDERPFLAKLYLALSIRKSGLGDLVGARQYAAEAIKLSPSLAGQLEEVIPDMAMNQTLGSPLTLVQIALKNLPGELAKSSRLRQRVLGKLHVAQAFNDYDLGHRAEARQHVFSGLRNDPSFLRNRGVLTVLARSFLNHPTADLKSTSIPHDFHESIPDSVVGAIEVALGCAIDNVERITTTKQRIYLIRAGEREYVLRILEGKKDVLERKIAIAKCVRAAGIPAPAPLVSSLAQPIGDHDPGWLLEEKMVGSFFEPWNMAQTDQLKIVADLGRCLRQLHSIKVRKFGPILSAQLDAPYPTIDAWLSSRQEAAAKACLTGAISETMLPTLAEAYHFVQEAYSGAPVLCHCELSSGNILMAGGRISALIDWESAAGNDPAYDVANLFTTMGRSWYPTQDHSMLTTFLQTYQPDEPDNFYRRVIAHRLLFIAGAITWLRQYGDEYYRVLIRIMSDAKPFLCLDIGSRLKF